MHLDRVEAQEEEGKATKGGMEEKEEKKEGMEGGNKEKKEKKQEGIEGVDMGGEKEGEGRTFVQFTRAPNQKMYSICPKVKKVTGHLLYLPNGSPLASYGINKVLQVSERLIMHLAQLRPHE